MFSIALKRLPRYLQKNKVAIKDQLVEQVTYQSRVSELGRAVIRLADKVENLMTHS